jgi:hypothetical protein
LVGGEERGFGRRAVAVIENGGDAVLAAPRGDPWLDESAEFVAPNDPGGGKSCAADRGVDEGKDEPDVGVDEALSVGCASGLSMPEGPFSLGGLVSSGVSFDHVTLALGCHVLDLLQGDGDFLGDRLVLFSELVRGGDGCLPDGRPSGYPTKCSDPPGSLKDTISI